MNLAVAVVGLFGLFSLVGGAIGYFKAKSGASLIAGTVSGLILLACAAGIARGQRLASIVSLIVALLLGGRFLGTWWKNHRVMPDGIMVVLSLLTLLAVGRCCLLSF